MYKLQLEVDESVLDKFMELLELIPKNKLKVISKQKSSCVSVQKAIGNSSSKKIDINELLKEHTLLHFSYFENGNEKRIIYTHEAETKVHVDDFNKLISVLNANNIKHHDIGMDILVIDEN
ncbi:MAG: hypothetical protein H8E76_07650 [Helicobacteraceae bacterium]|nr:hypothetical protein [Candidatus Sulfurimonas ponti]